MGQTRTASVPQSLPRFVVVESVGADGDLDPLAPVRLIALEELIAKVRAAAHVSTRTTIVLSTPWE